MSEPTAEFDALRQRITIELREPLTEEALEKISARLHKDLPRSVHVSIDWRDPDRDPDRRQVSQLVKALNPSLNAFIFDTPYDKRFGADICDVLEACPNLQRAFLDGSSTMRGTRHEHIRELLLMGNQLDASVIPGLAASQFPALETLALLHEKLEGFQPEELAESLRTVEAPRLAQVYITGVPVLEFLTAIGAAPLSWNLCINDFCFDDVEGLFQVLRQNDVLRGGKLRLSAVKLFASEIAQLAELGVVEEDWGDSFVPNACFQWSW
jgi:hypothetical protein